MPDASDCWDSELEISVDSKCPHHKKAAVKINFPPLIWKRVIRLTQELDTEWLGYLKATKVKQAKGIQWNVTELVVPPQEATMSKVDPTETVDAPGVIHSHAGGGAFFSGTDDEYINKNHEFSIVVNKSENCAAVGRLLLPCKALTLVDAKVFVDHEPSEADEWIEAAKKNVSKKVFTPVVRQWGDSSFGLYDDGPQVITNIEPPERKRGPSHTPPKTRFYTVEYSIPNLAAETRKEIEALHHTLNNGKLSKKKRKAAIRKLTELGAIVSERDGPVSVVLPGVVLGDFFIDGVESIGEKLAIGYYCTDCHAYASIRDVDKLIAQNPKTKETECIACGGCLSPIMADDITAIDDAL